MDKSAILAFFLHPGDLGTVDLVALALLALLVIGGGLALFSFLIYWLAKDSGEKVNHSQTEKEAATEKEVL